MKKAITRILLVFLILTTGMFSGCKTKESENVIRWGVFKNYNPVFIAQEMGFFEEEGITVIFTGEFSSGSAVIQAAAAKEIDAGHSAISGIINAVNSGIDIRGVLDSQSEFKDAPLMQWYIMESSGIQDPIDLKGKKIAINSLSGSFYHTFLLYLSQAGLSKDDVEFVVLAHNYQEQALLNGQVDVVSLIDPYTGHIEKTEGVINLFKAVDIIGEMQFSNVFFTTNYINKYPDNVEKFKRAYCKAITFIYENSELSSQIMAKSIGIDVEAIQPHKYTENANVFLDDVAFWISVMYENGEIDSADLNPNAVVEPKFNN